MIRRLLADTARWLAVVAFIPGVFSAYILFALADQIDDTMT